MPENKIIEQPEDAPVTMMVKTKEGNVDLNNLPGSRRLELIESGEMNIDQFITPANMPGSKLKELRGKYRQQMESRIKKGPDDVEVLYAPGDFVNYKDSSYEVIRTDPKRGLLIDREGQKVWVISNKVSKIS
jgi:hypothetical protein